MAGPIHIALTFDDTYWAPAYAVMRSVCLFTRRRGELVFHLLHHEVEEEHLADFHSIAREFGASLAFYDIDRNTTARSVLSRVPHSGRLPPICFARVLLEDFLPAEIERIIYLDCDTLVLRPIERLWESDLGGHPIAAVPDMFGPLIAAGRDMIDARGLFDLGDGYFNSGMLVIDMRAWRQFGVRSRLEAAIADGTLTRIYYDQDLLNLIFRNDWAELDIRWNFLAPLAVHYPLNPFVLHYVGERPWRLLARVAHARMYRHVMTNELFYRYMRYRWRRDWPGAASEIVRAAGRGLARIVKAD